MFFDHNTQVKVKFNNYPLCGSKIMPLNSFKKWKICIMEVKDYGLVNSNKKKKDRLMGPLRQTRNMHP